VSALSRLLQRANRHRAATIGLVILGIAAVLAIFGPLIAPFDPHTQVGPTFDPPSSAHPFGLDGGGIDVLSSVIVGARVSLLVALVATAVSIFIGATVGIVAGYSGGRVDAVLMRITDFFLVVPVLPLMIVVAAIWGPSLFHVMVVIGALLWTPVARVVRAQTLTVRERGFVRRAQAMGASSARIMWVHVLPQLRPLIMSNTALIIAQAILAEAALAFLGLESSDVVSWGTLISHAFTSASMSAGAWWAIVPAGLCIAIVVLACNLVVTEIGDRHGRHRPQHLSRRRPRVIREGTG
jgi:peptide/nickel transport system permease protein